MPRHIPIALLLFTALAIHAWGQPAVPLPKASIEVVLWASRDTPEARAAVQIAGAYQLHNPQVRVNIRYCPDTDPYKALQRWFDTYKIEASDLVIVPGQWVGEFADSLLPLDKGILSGFAPPVVSGLVKKDKALGVPWIVNTPALLCRSDLLPAGKKAAPTTWDSLETTASALTQRDKVWGMGLAADRSHAAQLLLQLLWTEGGEPFGTDGKLQLSIPELKAALSRLHSLGDSGGCQPELLSWSQSELCDVYAEGRLAMLAIDRSAERALARRKDVPAYTVARWPGSKRPTAMISLSLIVGTASTRKSAEVADFLKFVASPEAQKQLAVLADSVPCQRELMRTMHGEANLGAFIDALGDARALPAEGEGYSRLLQVYDWLVCEVVKGRYTPEKALAEAEKACREMDQPPVEDKPGPPAQ
jgi:ABC-type glycerol-3-phosphate transport system substrate-binding protein